MADARSVEEGGFLIIPRSKDIIYTCGLEGCVGIGLYTPQELGMIRVPHNGLKQSYKIEGSKARNLICSTIDKFQTKPKVLLTAIPFEYNGQVYTNNMLNLCLDLLGSQGLEIVAVEDSREIKGESILSKDFRMNSDSARVIRKNRYKLWSPESIIEIPLN